MKTFAYLLDDETNPPELWEIISRSDFGPVTLRSLDKTLTILASPEDVWEVCTF